MMADDFLVKGNRPPSVASTRQFTALKKDFGYTTKMPHSSVDETLFHSHHPSAINSPEIFPNVWKRKQTEDKKTQEKRDRPLLWCPVSRDKGAGDINNSKIPKSGTINGIPMKHQFRALKHTPTFVDETLFGDPLIEPSFKAPWEAKEKPPRQPYFWYPDVFDEEKTCRYRPKTATGLRNYGDPLVSHSLPIWKP